MEKFVPYLQSIGIRTDTLLRRIESIYRMVSKICPEQIEDIFVSEYIKDDKTREYESIWFFSANYTMEAKQFVTKDDFDIAPISNKVIYFTIRLQDYDFSKATPSSRLNLDFLVEGDTSCGFKATGENCDFLKNIIVSYVKPNLVL